MKWNKYILMLLTGMLCFQSCDNETYDVEGNPNNLIYFIPSTTGSAQGNISTFNVDWTSRGAVGDEVVVKLPVKSTRQAENTMMVYVEVDNSLVNSYNMSNGTSYEAFPSDVYTVVKSAATIEQGKTLSVDSIEVRVPAENFVALDKSVYLLPVRLTKVEGNGKISVQHNTALAIVNITYPDEVKLDVSITNGTNMGTSVLDISALPASYAFTVSATGNARQDETVTLEVDRSLVEYYNTSKNTNYVALPQNADVTVTGLEAAISWGEKLSSEIKVTLNSLNNLEMGTTYMLPITIKEVSSGLQLKENYTTMYLLLDYIDPNSKFVALDISNYECYSNYYFAESLQKELTNFTYEIKIHANQLSGMSRFFAFNGSNTVMFRFGEGGNDATRLQCVTGKGNFFANTSFETGKWYLLSLTYDGSKFAFYVNGVKDCEYSVSDYSTLFKGVEIGMSWAGYPSQQNFNGSICETRIWNRTLTESELSAGICGVEPDSQGLQAYWKMNEGEGHIFYDYTGNGYNIDWSDTWRCLTESESDPGTHLTDRHNYIGWDKSDSNVCK
ncbi:DUF1735 and LamG domain-containing protein [Bacteroides sp. GM023]|uniref:DUF1735 and LamG domain-containing protein n=1 Tax=Bacteroides sp. GM023 TaxID=2723058 RepID=UPI00168B06B7|nr:DUF1735 and LamG domain-containing protein [Bacteroides sp. GM023]MBD3591754.1 DUF1735 domain-containing protein [Bacteroides sp. GM023]